MFASSTFVSFENNKEDFYSLAHQHWLIGLVIQWYLFGTRDVFRCVAARVPAK
jgi:hypothetical protein